MSDEFEIFSYSPEKLKKVIVEKTKTSLNVIQRKIQLAYFEKKFEKINPITVLVEKNYIDRDFLEDYSNYYIKCFANYSSKCTRLHFFNLKFSKIDFDNFLEGKVNSLKIEEIQNHYLGFIVIKPLPKTFIGRCCLEPYIFLNSSDKELHSLITRTYKVNLFGISLSLKSLAFQEQDSVVSACATSALWSVFHSTGILFQHFIPSPVEITKKANEYFPLDTRLLPNKGLKISQMAQAIRSVGLEPFLVKIDNEENLKRTIYAYLHGGFPFIMGIDLYNNIEDKYIGAHAVAVTGYKLTSLNTDINNQENFYLKASRIEEIYVHDDQVEPFTSIVSDGCQKNGFIYLSHFLNKSEIMAVPFALLIPLYHKIRIPLNVIYQTVYGFNKYIEILVKFNLSILQESTEMQFFLKQYFEWDIYLTTVNNFKEEIIRSSYIEPSVRKNVLLQAMPHFLWCASAYCNKNRVLDLIFDATDIEQGSFFLRAIEYNRDFSIFLRDILKTRNSQMEWFFREIEGSEKMVNTLNILEWFRN